MNGDHYIGPTALDPGPQDPGRFAGHVARWVTLPLAVVVLAVILVFYVFFSSAVVHGRSMEPTLITGDYLLITHGNWTPQRGDIVVVRTTDTKTETELVKRVVGIPGDRVEIRDDVAIVNGTPEPQVGQVVIPQLSTTLPPVVVPSGHVYLMGDNRPVSEDSRFIGVIPITAIRGEVVFVFAPVSRIRPI